MPDPRTGRLIDLSPVISDGNVPFHRFADGHDLTGLDLQRVAAVPAVCLDPLNIDSTDDGARPVHTTLLRAGVPIIEHLTNLAELPDRSFRFTAVPPAIRGAGTVTVRACATLDGV